MGAAHTLTAVYSPVYALTINSQNPASGVPITVWTADYSGQKNGTTSFNRTYAEGTVASLTAPATAGGNSFIRWEKNGVSMGILKTVSVTMNAAHSLTAVYSPTRIATVQSAGASAVPITVYQSDIAGAKNGVTTFSRTYVQGTTFSMTAPATAGGKTFVRWEKDGVTATTFKTITVNMSDNHTLTAVYN
jgi:hypothetical protein